MAEKLFVYNSYAAAAAAWGERAKYLQMHSGVGTRRGNGKLKIARKIPYKILIA